MYHKGEWYFPIRYVLYTFWVFTPFFKIPDFIVVFGFHKRPGFLFSFCFSYRFIFYGFKCSNLKAINQMFFAPAANISRKNCAANCSCWFQTATRYCIEIAMRKPSSSERDILNERKHNIFAKRLSVFINRLVIKFIFIPVFWIVNDVIPYSPVWPFIANDVIVKTGLPFEFNIIIPGIFCHTCFITTDNRCQVLGLRPKLVFGGLRWR